MILRTILFASVVGVSVSAGFYLANNQAKAVSTTALTPQIEKVRILYAEKEIKPNELIYLDMLGFKEINRNEVVNTNIVSADPTNDNSVKSRFLNKSAIESIPAGTVITSAMFKEKDNNAAPVVVAKKEEKPEKRHIVVLENHGLEKGISKADIYKIDERKGSLVAYTIIHKSVKIEWKGNVPYFISQDGREYNDIFALSSNYKFGNGRICFEKCYIKNDALEKISRTNVVSTVDDIIDETALEAPVVDEIKKPEFKKGEAK